MKNHSPTLRVREHVARNPVARAVEKQRQKAFFTRMGLDILAAQEGEPVESLIQGSAECLSITIKAIEGIDDPHDVGGLMVDAMAVLVEMSLDGFRWRTKHAELLTDALDASVQLLAVVDPADRVRGWNWTQAINRRLAAQVAEKVAA